MRKSALAVCVFTSSALLIAASALPASAESANPPDSTTATAVTQGASAAANAGGTVLGGTLSATVFGANLSPATLNGAGTQTMTGTSAPWTLVDGRGTGVAWNLAVSVSNFTSAAVTTGTTPQPLRTIYGSNLAIAPGNFAVAPDTASGITLATGSHDSDAGDGSGQASGTKAAVVAETLDYSNSDEPVSGVTLVWGADSVAGTNRGGGAKGSYIFTAPSFTLTIPRNSYKSNVDNSSGSPVVQPYVAVITFTIS
jgi:hypothetical protein